MENDLKNKHSGKIIFWNKIYGFIQQKNSESIFFHKNNISPQNRDNLELLNEVEYKVSIVEEGKHKGKSIATNIKKIKSTNISEYERYVGRLTKWNGHYGYIESPQQNSTVLFFKTRSFWDDEFQNEDLIIFHQVKSNKSPNQLFALFAYPIRRETEIPYLQKQYEDSGIEGIKEHISFLIYSQTNIPLNDRFEQELLNIGRINNPEAFQSLLAIIKKYSSDSFTPDFELLKRYCEDKYLIQLWESDIIADYDIELVKHYFHNALADIKRFIIIKVNSSDRKEILFSHFEKLQQEGRLRTLNNNVKTLLDIVYKNPESKNLDVFFGVKEYLLSNLGPKELIELWLNGYIDKLNEQFIIDNFDIDNYAHVRNLINKEDDENIELLKLIYENYFLNFSENDFDKEVPRLIQRLIIFEKEYGSRYKEIIEVIRKIFDNHKLFILWLFGVSLEFDAINYIKENNDRINDYFKIKFLLHKSIEATNPEIVSLVKVMNITYEGIEIFATTYKWNDLIHPTEIDPIEDTNSFIPDIKEFIFRYKFIVINIDNLCLSIFNELPKYQIHHVRLWLYNYVPNDYYDYIGFRNLFKSLTNEERTRFKKKGDKLSYLNNVFLPESIEVEPCNIILLETESEITYSAVLSNLFFGNGYFMLRIEDKTYTQKKEHPSATSGLNRFPATSNFNKYPIKVTISKDKEIIDVEGLNEIFTLIQTGEIEKALGIIAYGIDDENQDSNISYPEDFELRKQIIDFLNQSQYEDVEPQTVYEPKNHYRRLDENSGVDSEELTRLFSIKLEDGFGIVWENIDLTGDRATYIFKSTKENLHIQLEKIAHGITSFAQFRSALLSKKDQNELHIFKNNFGYIASIRKRKGRNQPFDNWVSKLHNYFLHPIPPLPTMEEIKSIEMWSPEVPHRPSIRPVIKKIRDEEIPEVNFDFDGMQKAEKRNAASENGREKILSLLQKFNTEFLANFNIEKNE